MSLLDDAAFMTLSPIKMIEYLQRQFIMSDPAIASVLSHLHYMLENNVPPSHVKQVIVSIVMYIQKQEKIIQRLQASVRLHDDKMDGEYCTICMQEYEKTNGQGYWIIVDMSFMQIVLKIGCYEFFQLLVALTFEILTSTSSGCEQFVEFGTFSIEYAMYLVVSTIGNLYNLDGVPDTRGTLSGFVLVSKGNVPVSQNVPTFDSSYRTDDESYGITSIRRSSRVSKLSKKLKDFVLDNKVKYDLNRPDIAYSVHCLRQHTHSPLQSHFEAALRVLRYLKSAHGAGKRFAFVRLIKVFNLDRLVENLCTIWIGRYHLYANSIRFERSHKSFLAHTANAVEVSKKSFAPQYSNARPGSYANVVNGASLGSYGSLLSTSPAMGFGSLIMASHRNQWNADKRHYASNEDSVLKISNSVYVTNFPDSCSSRDLWKACSVYGTVVDVYIPFKKSKA
nr:zinc finger, RING/FYVE/PHD-type [Tanacetum cinerariifolium]